jgi:hypothetical protein
MKAADGGPVSGAKAILSRVVDGVDSFPKDTATSDAAGNYTFGNVPALPGFAITVQAEGYQTAAATGLAVAYAHTLRADFPLVPATQIGSGPGSVAGFVTDSAQGALAGARIILDSAGSDGRSRLASQTDAQGRFVFPKVNAGDYRLSVSRDGYMPLEIVGLSVSPDRTLVERLALRKAPINGLLARTREAMRLRAGPAGRLILTAPAGPVAGRVRVYDARGTLRFSGTLLPGAARLEIPWASGRTGYVVVERAGEVHRFRFPAGR